MTMALLFAYRSKRDKVDLVFFRYRFYHFPGVHKVEHFPRGGGGNQRVWRWGRNGGKKKKKHCKLGVENQTNFGPGGERNLSRRGGCCS